MTQTPLQSTSHRSRKPSRFPEPDLIDRLDTIGGFYHHDGPYDATLASRNLNKKYSPVAAVQDTNNEALRATPRHYVKDALDRHMPLQGTAVLPSGVPDLGGEVMDYEEGADLMRERDAAGGAYKRYDDLTYQADDLKGKAEPSYSLEKAEKEKKLLLSTGEEYEMRSGFNGDGYLGPAGIMRSRSNAGASSERYAQDASGLQRSSTTGKKVGSGLKRRLGSLRKKRDVPATEI